MEGRIKDFLNYCIFILLILGVATLMFFIGYEAGKGKKRVIQRPYKIYSDLTIQPMSESGLVGIIDKRDLESFLEIRDSIPFSKEVKK